MAERRIRTLNIEEVERIAFKLAQEHLAFDEPIPDFTTRYPSKLESCIETPFQKLFGKVLYGSLLAKASELFYLLVKNHPFQNGNKRIAITTLMVFLLKNDKWLAADLTLIHKFTIWVASSSAQDKDFVVMAINEFLRRHLKNLARTPLFK